MNSSESAPRWMRHVLLAAAAYNILWGAWVVLFPNAIWNLLSMTPPNYPQLWQCIGMIVGVYGLGYGIAAFDPARHWPIVLVGFLGKIFGPLGMIQALWTGALPWGFSLTCLTNDLIWWVPFALILRYAWLCAVAENDPAGTLPSEEELLESSLTSNGRSLAALSFEKPVLLVLLRHSGCSFCREAMADLQKARPALEARGVQLALGHMGEPAGFAGFAASYGLGDVPAVSDPERRLYRGLGLRRGTLGQLLGWRVWRRGAQAFFHGHAVGALEGDGLQMPGVFVLSQGRVEARRVHQTSGERPDYVAFSAKSAGLA